MASFTYDAINAQGVLLTRRDPRGRPHRRQGAAARARPAAAGAEGAPGQRSRRGRTTFKKVKPQLAPDLLAPARHDDRVRRERRAGVRDARAADRRQVPARDHRRDPLRRRSRDDPVQGVRAASEGLQPPVRGDDRVRRVVGNPRHRARPRSRSRSRRRPQIKRRVKSAMVYPLVVLTFATLVLIFMLMFIVPVFVKVFDQLHGQLPKPTQIVVTMSNVLRSWWCLIFPVIGAVDLRPPRAASRRSAAAASGTGSSSASR